LCHYLDRTVTKRQKQRGRAIPSLAAMDIISEWYGVPWCPKCVAGSGGYEIEATTTPRVPCRCDHKHGFYGWIDRCEQCVFIGYNKIENEIVEVFMCDAYAGRDGSLSLLTAKVWNAHPTEFDINQELCYFPQHWRTVDAALVNAFLKLCCPNANGDDDNTHPAVFVKKTHSWKCKKCRARCHLVINPDCDRCSDYAPLHPEKKEKLSIVRKKHEWNMLTDADCGYRFIYCGP